MRPGLTPTIDSARGSTSLPRFVSWEVTTMDELRRLVCSYESYFEMFDDGPSWRRGAAIDSRIRTLVRQLRAEGHGPEIDELAAQYPGLISCPGGAHALA
jgi:hypothetical protein